MTNNASLLQLAAALSASALFFAAPLRAAQPTTPPNAYILTPPPPATPRINGPTIFGVRPGSPFLYTIPATGDRPLSFSIDNLPAGLHLDPATGQITGTLSSPGEFKLTFHAHNDKGDATKAFRIVVGDKIGLTPAMGWNSWNCWAGSVDQEKVLRSAKALVASGLKDHGWSYINIDDTWQAPRNAADGKAGPLRANEKFPDMKALTDQIHAMGLKAGIYSTPWITSYAKFPGGSSDSPDGHWTKSMANGRFWRNGKHGFEPIDAKQFADWGFDYLKYDWYPNDLPHVKAMSDALRHSGRDILFSLSNTAPFSEAAELAKFANSWRTTSDIWDQWNHPDGAWHYSVSEIAFNQDRWAPYAAPGHFNDPDMLVVGWVGWGPKLHPSALTPDEQYTHITMWCMLSAPLLIGCDLDRLDPFTLNLLTNDEVLAVDQDALGKQAQRVATLDAIDVYTKDLEDGTKALAFFNRANIPVKTRFTKMRYIGFNGPQHLRDLWRQKDLPGTVRDDIDLNLPAHGVLLYKVTPAK